MEEGEEGIRTSPIVRAAPKRDGAAIPSGSITFAAGALRAALGNALCVIERCNTIPALSCVLIRMAEPHVSGKPPGGAATVARFTADNLDMRLTLDVPASGGIDPVCLPARRLWLLLAGLAADDMVRIRPDGEGLAYVDLPDGMASVMTLPAGEFPLASTGVEWGGAFGMPARDLIDIARFACLEETRYYLNGVCLDISEAGILGVATDGHRLARQMLGPRGNDMGDIRPIIPFGAIRALARLGLGKGGLTARLGMMQVTRVRTNAAGQKEEYLASVAGRVSFEAADGKGFGLQLVTRTIDGDFPDWRKVLDLAGKGAAGKEPLSTDRDAMRGKLARFVAARGFHSACLDIEGKAGGLVTGTCGDEEARITLALPLRTDRDFSISVNAYYLAEAFAFLPAGEVALALGGAGDPFEMTAGPRSLLQMPMRGGGAKPLALPEGVRA